MTLWSYTILTAAALGDRAARNGSPAHGASNPGHDVYRLFGQR